MSATATPRTKLSRQIRLLLADQMVEVELDQDHIDLAIDMAIERLRQRSDGASQEQVLFLSLQADQTRYTLPDNVQEIWKIHRRGVGAYIGGNGVNFDPINASFVNYYMMQGGQTGGLATWELFGEYKETLSRLFASEINFIWNVDTHTLEILRRPVGEETVMVTVYAQKTEDTLLTNPYTGPWLRDFALATAKQMLGQARSKYQGLPGPQGALSMNGDALKQEAAAEFERLEKEVLNFVTSNSGLPFIIG